MYLVGERGLEIYNTFFPNNGSCESMFGVEEIQEGVADHAENGENANENVHKKF